MNVCHDMRVQHIMQSKINTRGEHMSPIVYTGGPSSQPATTTAALAAQVPFTTNALHPNRTSHTHRVHVMHPIHPHGFPNPSTSHLPFCPPEPKQHKGRPHVTCCVHRRFFIATRDDDGSFGRCHSHQMQCIPIAYTQPSVTGYASHSSTWLSKSVDPTPSILLA